MLARLTMSAHAQPLGHGTSSFGVQQCEANSGCREPQGSQRVARPSCIATAFSDRHRRLRHRCTLSSQLRSPVVYGDLSRSLFLGQSVLLFAATRPLSSPRSSSLQAVALLDALPDAGPIRDAVFASSGALVAFALSAGLAWFMQRSDKKMKAAAEERGPASIPELRQGPPIGLAQALEMGVGGQKESVEWVNMVLHKIWKVYRRSLEAWLVGLLQPAIDTLPLPGIVRRVEIAEFSLDYEPLSVRNVQRRASRRANDLQYHVGLRYTGDARCLLLLHLTVAGVDFAVPVGVHNLDVDAELWVKLRLTPRKPYVGTLSIAFVRLPTIKLVLAPFRIVNLFAIPFLSSFLSKLLTVDLPRLLVLPRHITFDFLPAGEEVPTSLSTAGIGGAPQAKSSADLVLDLLKSETFTGLAEKEPHSQALRSRGDPSDHFVGELTVTLCEARNLPSLGLAVWSNPYCRLMVGDTAVESKRNSETSHPAGARDPVWNQDFLFWVEDPAKQKLVVVIRDSMAPLSRNIGFVEVPIWQLQDCAPLSMWLPLLQDGPFGVKPAQGEIRLLLTYKSYVDQRDAEEGSLARPSPPQQDVVAYIKVFGESEGDEEVTGADTETEADSDSEREKELQRERAKKGLDKLGEEPGVEVVASNVGVGAQADLEPSLPITGVPPAPLPAEPAEGRKGIARSAWAATKAVTLGTVSVAGGILKGTGNILAGAGGLIAAGAGGALAGAGAIASGVGSGVKSLWRGRSDGSAEPPLYLYEDDDYFSDDPLSVRVHSYPDSDHEGDRDGAEGVNTKHGYSSEVNEEAHFAPPSTDAARGGDAWNLAEGNEMWDSAFSRGHERARDGGLSSWDDYKPERVAEHTFATAEQRIARMVEFNLDTKNEDILQSLASSPRLGTSLVADDGEPSAASKHSQSMHANEEDGSHQGNVGEVEIGTQDKDRWRSVQGAISDLLDFFNR